MPDAIPTSLVPWLVLILAAEFVNGWTDAPNAIATSVSTRVLSPRRAVAMAAVMNAAGALAGTGVAATIGQGIVRPEVVDIQTVGAAMVGIVVWSTLAWSFGLPTSESHALVAGLSGAALAVAGPSALVWDGWSKVLIGIGFSSVLGLAAGMMLMALVYRLFGHRSPGLVRGLFGRLQILSAALMAFGHGSNDGQKFIGVFTLALVLGGALPVFDVQLWVILLCAGTMGIGTAAGGFRIIRTLGMRLTKLDPPQGFAAETGAGLNILLASYLGIPLSTTHTISTSIIGVGAARRWSAVRWGVAGHIVLAWILTFPICAAIAYGVARVIR